MSHCVTAGGGLGELLLEAARAAIAAVGGEALVERALAGRARDLGSDGNVYVAGAGKAVEAMAAGARRALGARLRAGILIGKGDHREAARAVAGLPLRLAGHPVPDERSVAAACALVAWLGTLDDRDEVIFLLSGGASALLGAPLPGLTLADLGAATDTLLASGAAIAEINAVRRHLGLVQGGRLAAATRARLEVLALSDVIGDDPAAIGSGPASADPTTFADALAVAERRGLARPVRAFLERGARGAEEETLKPGDPRLARVRHRLLATPLSLLAAAALALRDRGRAARVEDALVDGDVEAVAARYARLAGVLPTGVAQVAVGEPTVRLPPGTAAGQGGRAQHLALLVARHIAGTGAVFLALGSDGSDGPTDAAGALVDGDTWARALALGLDPDGALARCASHPLLDALGALVRTGPTGTNLLDLHLLATDRSG